jgi:NADH-quinone oxidoreductase subunit M
MNFQNFPIVSFVLFFPLAGAFIILFLKRKNEKTIKNIAFITSLLNFIWSLDLYFRFDRGSSNVQLAEKINWIKDWGASYYVGIDGINLLLILLTTFITPLAILSSWNAIKDRVKEYMIVMLLLETGMIGVFVSFDILLFYIFWEAMLIPMYLLIGVWGGQRRIYAAVKFFLYTMVGSVLMLIAILFVYFMHHKLTGEYTFDLLRLYNTSISLKAQLWLFSAFALAFAIKVPLFPFHTWLPDAHVEAPTAGSVILAGVLLKMGTYGFVRFCLPLFPNASITFIPWISLLAVIGIVYGALVSMVQPDIKKLVAYSSVSHLGFVMLGLFAMNLQGMSGGMIQMINHGLSTGALFLIVGMIYERRHTRMIDDFGGLSKVIPMFSAFFLVVTLSSIGLPGLNGFIGEFLVLVGSFKANFTGTFTPNILFPIFATSGVVLSAIYMLWMFQRVMQGPIKHDENKSLLDLTPREIAILVPIIILIIWIGVYPKPFLGTMDVSLQDLMNFVQERSAEYSSMVK